MSRFMGVYGIFQYKKLLHIGQSCNVKSRVRFHLWQLRSDIHPNGRLQKIFNKDDNMSFRLLERIKNKEDLARKEIYYMKKHQPVCNIFTPDDNGKWISSLDRNLKISIAHKGVPKSAEHRQSMSRARKGVSTGAIPWNKGSGSYMARSNNHFFGKHHSEETKNLISAKNKIKVDIKEIIKLRKEGLSFEDIGKRFGISRTTAQRRYNEEEKNT